VRSVDEEREVDRCARNSATAGSYVEEVGGAVFMEGITTRSVLRELERVIVVDDVLNWREL